MASRSTIAVLTPSEEADSLRRQMRTIRRELGNDVEELVVQAERLMDWRYYIQQYPWAMTGLAAIVGYFIVPRRNVTLPTDASTLARLAEKIPVMMPTPPQPKKQGLVGSLISMGTSYAMRAALAYATQQLSKQFLPPAPAPRPEEQHHV